MTRGDIFCKSASREPALRLTPTSRATCCRSSTYRRSSSHKRTVRLPCRGTATSGYSSVRRTDPKRRCKSEAACNSLRRHSLLPLPQPLPGRWRQLGGHHRLGGCRWYRGILFGLCLRHRLPARCGAILFAHENAGVANQSTAGNRKWVCGPLSGNLRRQELGPSRPGHIPADERFRTRHR